MRFSVEDFTDRITLPFLLEMDDDEKEQRRPLGSEQKDREEELVFQMDQEQLVL